MEREREPLPQPSPSIPAWASVVLSIYVTWQMPFCQLSNPIPNLTSVLQLLVWQFPSLWEGKCHLQNSSNDRKKITHSLWITPYNLVFKYLSLSLCLSVSLSLSLYIYSLVTILVSHIVGHVISRCKDCIKKLILDFTSEIIKIQILNKNLKSVNYFLFYTKKTARRKSKRASKWVKKEGEWEKMGGKEVGR